ncbi:VWFA and cache domain-containing protein 1-like, partial [Saccoglossus kowalevskii]|uniref:VWFA and cache domain-containing protein 1-like n=1 Tax=Saccoglossus kowalevskii TaxID=10224 RepID=A0ABM0M8G2_SACKO
RTLIHPLFPAPDALEEDPVFVHITSLERSDEFKTILSKSIADGKNFEIMAVSFISTRSIARGDSATEGVLTTKLPSKYYCKAVGGGIPYVVCAVIADEDRQTKLGSYTPTGNDFMYHRIDILAPESRCRIRNKTATTDHSTVKFSPDAFRDPKYYISNEEDINIVQLYTQYMNDITGHIPSDLFKESVRAAVVATAITEEIWKNASQYDSRQFITAYFIGTDNGVFRIFPGQQLGNSYDHATRPWYKRVKGNVNKHTLSIPYNDDFENDYVITLSHTIVESSISDQATSDEIRAVVGIDFTVEYFHLLVTDGYPQCVENQYSCFVMDSSGYLVIHNDFIEANGDINIENLHITEIEPDIARDLISKGVLIKSQCVNFQTIKQQNYYIAERRSDIDNLADSDSCKRYQLSYISGTNVYLGIINKDDCPETRETKCICESQCRDTENTECECPCLSDAVYDYCNDEFHYTSDSHPACTPKIRDLNIITQAESDVSHLSQCFETHCSEKQNAVECNAAVNCVWCMDGSPRCEDSVYHCKPPHVSSGLSTGIKTGIAISVLAAIGIIIVVIVFIVVRHHREANVLDYIDKYTDNEYDVPSAPPKPSDATPAEEDTLNYELAEDYILPDTHDSDYVYHNHEHDSD